MKILSKNIGLIVFAMMISFIVKAQEDSLMTDQVVVDTLNIEYDSFMAHPPRKATILAAVLPSAGQLYNKKYWKMPLVYFGFGVSGYYLNRNLNDIKFFRENLQAEIDDDPLTINETGATEQTLLSALDRSKSLRDWSYIAIVGVYVLQIIDANVDAHLWHFDVNDDLCLTTLPTIILADKAQPGFSLTLNF
ncbi:MAG: hypothetical protein ACI8XB_003114 [Patiriisocius sp.]|jgi:hypothetical protein